MSEKIKLLIVGVGSAALLAFAAAAIWYVNSYSKSIGPDTYRSFSVTAEGKMVAVPDVANITFSVITQNGDLAALQKENTEKVNKAIDFVKSKGVDAKDIKTQNYNIEPRYQYYSCNPWIGGAVSPIPCPPPVITGYSVTQTVSVKVRDFKILGSVLSGVVEQGANSVSAPYFTVDDPTELQNQARKEAIEKAKVRAKEIADAGGFRLGKLLSIDEGGYYPQPIYFKEALNGRGGGVEPAPAPQIEPGSQEITVTVILRYAIE